MGALSLALSLGAESAQAQSQDGPIEIGGDRNARPAVEAAPAIDTTAELPDAAAPKRDPVGLARFQAPMALIDDDALLLERLKRKDIVHRLRGIDVPFRLLEPEAGQPDANIWHKGPMPDKTLLARLRTAPIGEAVTTITTKTDETGELRLAEAQWRSTDDPKPTYSLAGKIYCARDAQIGGKKGDTSAVNMCLIDEDRDGVFDAYSTAEGQRKGTVHSLYLVGPPLPLATPLPYTVADTPTLANTAEWHSCGKDWDLPYFRPYMLEGAVPIAAKSQITPRRQGVYCDKAEAVETIEPLNKGGRVASLGGLVFDIGKKSKGAKATVVELRQQDRIYREEDGKVVPLSVGMTPTHVAVATAQQFDQKPYQFNGQYELKEGSFGKDETFLTVGFKHGYNGVVTQDVTIRTLLSKREVPAGTHVYGVPAEKRTVLVGYYGDQIMGPPVKRKVNTGIVWCLPSREEEAVKERNSRRQFVETGEIKVIWSATCLPETSAGNHTVLEGQDPALAVRNMRMNASISTNDGPPPVRETDVSDFGGALTFRYSVASVSDRFVTLKEEVMLGDEVTSDKEVLVLNQGDRGVPFDAAGGAFLMKIDSTDAEKPTFTVEQLRETELDEEAPIKGIDIAALLRRLLGR